MIIIEVYSPANDCPATEAFCEQLDNVAKLHNKHKDC